LCPRTILTIGHSNHTLETFLDLLGRQQIEMLVDVRSSPYSQYSLHFNREPLHGAVEARGVQYLFLGDTLGGRPPQHEFYDEEGFVRYDRLAQSPPFRSGIARLLRSIDACRAALLCGEEDPTDCHRRRLIGRVLEQQGVKVFHLRGDGRVESEAEIAAEEEFRKTKGQQTLFDLEAPDLWRSSRSVLPRRPLPSSSTPCDGPESGE